MILNEHQSVKIKRIISRSYSEELDENFFIEIAPDICKLLDVHYFATVLFQNKYSAENIFISNNPQEFLKIYEPIADQDFILSNLIETNKPTVFRDLVDRNVPHNKEFVHETQKNKTCL